MADWNDELLTIYLAESKDHLSDIETDLLTIEASGADIDEELVNKVFRAAHSIKGGAGFFNLTKIQELGHKTENILELIRSLQMVPTSEVVNVLLISFDKLREMIDNPEQSNETDIADFVAQLMSLTDVKPVLNDTSQEIPVVDNLVEIPLPNERNSVAVFQSDLNQVQREGGLIYLIEYDMVHDMQRIDRTPLDVIRDLETHGRILDAVVDTFAVGTLDDDDNRQITFYVLYATEKQPGEITEFLQVDEDKIFQFNLPEEDDEEVIEESPAAIPEPQVVFNDPIPFEPEPVIAMPIVQENVEIERPHPQSHPAQKDAAASASAQGDTSLRVSVNLLESLMNLAGELVLSRNQLVEAISKHDTRLIHASGQRINLVTSELQETIMLTRMQPVGNVLNKFTRVIRDMSRDFKKDIQLQISGKDVEMDKTIIEGLSDPLTHLVRNSVDHGVETPEERIKIGKNPSGTVVISVAHEAGQVVIEIGDDGKGIDVTKVTKAALNKGIVTQEQLKTMSENEKMFLIFQPGLSTSEKITDVSGRGVGMDVVKTNLDRLGGKIEIDSELGKGTTFRIKLPLTLAIIPSLLVSIGGERFAIPQVNVREMICVSAEQVKDRIEVVGDSEVLILRGELIPIIELSKVLGIERTYIDDNGVRRPERRARIVDRRSRKHPVDNVMPPPENDREVGRRYSHRSDLNIVIVTAGALQYGLVVEQLHDTVEIVVKPLGRHLKESREYAGATIMGDGRVALILDVTGIAAKASLTSMSGTSRAQELADENRRDLEAGDGRAFLLFNNGANEHCAVPLNLVSRIEHIQTNQVETLGGKRTMQYRAGSLPLVTMSDAINVDMIGNDQDLVVIVFEISGREIGLLATVPVDIIETKVTIDQSTLKQIGVIGSTIIGDRTTLIVDIFGLVQAAHPEWIIDDTPPVAQVASEVSTVLLAEDSTFFRCQIKKFLEEENYEVLDAEDGQAAWELLEKNGDRVCLVVTDIEMPRLDGLGLTQNIRSDPRFSHLPIIAVTSLASEEDYAKGKAMGIDDYQIKLDKDKVLSSAKKLLGAMDSSN